MIAFIDGILVYSKSKVKYEERLKKVISSLKANSLYAKFSKCQIWL